MKVTNSPGREELAEPVWRAVSNQVKVDMRTAEPVRLEPWREADWPLLVRLNQPDMTEHLGGPESEGQLLERQRRYVAATLSPGAYVFRVEVGPGRFPVGLVAFWDRDWEGETVYEIG